MIYFTCDYSEGAHQKILHRLFDTNFLQTPGYGVDEYCQRAAELIRKLCKNENLGVHFLVGGTQTNALVIDACLRSHQGVLCVKSGHIAVHETGAVEAYGHKVLTLDDITGEGKITAKQIEEYVTAHYDDPSREHTVQPAMVYISNSTECGCVYKKAELEEISAVCRRHGLILYLDGARLGYALMCDGADFTLADLARLCDAFYMGGTKQGMLFGEALVINNPAINKDMRYIIKQHGAMLAKGRLLGLQFEAMLEDGLYFDIAANTNRLALKMRDALAAKGVNFRYPSPTNQQFPILSDEIVDKLAEKFVFERWIRVDDTHTAIRLCTSFATKEADVDTFINEINKIL